MKMLGEVGMEPISLNLALPGRAPGDPKSFAHIRLSTIPPSLLPTAKLELSPEIPVGKCPQDSQISV